MCKIKRDEINYKKDRTVCKSCYNKMKRKSDYNTLIQASNIDNVNNEIFTPRKQKHENNPIIQHMKVMPIFVLVHETLAEKYCMWKTLDKIVNKRPIFLINRSPNQNPVYKTSNEIKPINKYKGSVVFFDEKLGALNSSEIDELFTRKRQEKFNRLFN